MRVCFSCNSTKTYLNCGKWPQWNKVDWFVPLWFCDKCRGHYLRMAWRIRYGLKRYTLYHGIRLQDKTQPRTGYCSQCSNNVHNGTCKITNMHHRYYLRICPWFGRIELCASCHSKISAKESWKKRRRSRAKLSTT